MSFLFSMLKMPFCLFLPFLPLLSFFLPPFFPPFLIPSLFLSFCIHSSGPTSNITSSVKPSLIFSGTDKHSVPLWLSIYKDRSPLAPCCDSSDTCFITPSVPVTHTCRHHQWCWRAKNGVQSSLNPQPSHDIRKQTWSHWWPLNVNLSLSTERV